MQLHKTELDATPTQASTEPATRYRSEVQKLQGQDQIQELGDNEPKSPVELPADGNSDMRYLDR
jgi:hypothetical protein